MDNLFGNMGDMKEKLLRLLKGENICDGCPTAVYTVVAPLSADELREDAIIKAEEKRLSDAIEKISKEREMLNARKKIFFGKIQIRFGEFKSSLVVKEGKAQKIECGDKDHCSNLPFPLPGM